MYHLPMTMTTEVLIIYCESFLDISTNYVTFKYICVLQSVCKRPKNLKVSPPKMLVAQHKSELQV